MSAFADARCVIRGGGDLATGVAWRLTRAGFPVIVTELAEPLTVRRTVALSTAVAQGTVDVEGMTGRRVSSVDEAVEVSGSGDVAVLVSPELPAIDAFAVVDARLAKRNIDTTVYHAPVVVGLGPGFTAGVDCHAVIETQRGHHLGRVLWSGSAAPNTGTPGLIDGRGVERVIRAPLAGVVRWDVGIGDTVVESQVLGTVGGRDVVAAFDGVVRGLIAGGVRVRDKMKIGDVDPRLDASWNEISDKALAIGGGVLEAVLVAWNRSH